jgi:aminoglycoside 3-N-acetyltransferase
MVTFRELTNAFRRLEIDRKSPVIAHASLSSFGPVHGGAETLVGALLASFDTLFMPTFTYKTMLIPEVGPDNNGIAYGSGRDTNRMAEFFIPTMPADKLMGIVPETLRKHPRASRSMHPLLSFSGVGAEKALAAQTLGEPLGPIRVLADEQGWVLLLGVDHTVNTSIHYAEHLLGRKQFTRWALTPQGVLECPSFPGCSDGFEALAPYLQDAVRRQPAGKALIQAFPLSAIVESVQTRLNIDPLAFLCSRADCERCSAVIAQAA